MKGQVVPNESSARELQDHGELCGWILARAHARSHSAPVIAAYLGKSDAFVSAVARFAERFAQQNEKDHEQFKCAVKRGEFPAERDV